MAGQRALLGVGVGGLGNRGESHKVAQRVLRFLVDNEINESTFNLKECKCIDVCVTESLHWTPGTNTTF